METPHLSKIVHSWCAAGRELPPPPKGGRVQRFFDFQALLDDSIVLPGGRGFWELAGAARNLASVGDVAKGLVALAEIALCGDGDEVDVYFMCERQWLVPAPAHAADTSHVWPFGLEWGACYADAVTSERPQDRPIAHWLYGGSPASADAFADPNIVAVIFARAASAAIKKMLDEDATRAIPAGRRVQFFVPDVPWGNSSTYSTNGSTAIYYGDKDVEGYRARDVPYIGDPVLLAAHVVHETLENAKSGSISVYVHSRRQTAIPALAFVFEDFFRRSELRIYAVSDYVCDISAFRLIAENNGGVVNTVLRLIIACGAEGGVHSHFSAVTASASLSALGKNKFVVANLPVVAAVTIDVLACRRMVFATYASAVAREQQQRNIAPPNELVRGLAEVANTMRPLRGGDGDDPIVTDEFMAAAWSYYHRVTGEKGVYACMRRAGEAGSVREENGTPASPMWTLATAAQYAAFRAATCSGVLTAPEGPQMYTACEAGGRRPVSRSVALVTEHHTHQNRVSRARGPFPGMITPQGMDRRIALAVWMLQYLFCRPLTPAEVVGDDDGSLGSAILHVRTGDITKSSVLLGAAGFLGTTQRELFSDARKASLGDVAWIKISRGDSPSCKTTNRHISPRLCPAEGRAEIDVAQQFINHNLGFTTGNDKHPELTDQTLMTMGARFPSAMAIAYAFMSPGYGVHQAKKMLETKGAENHRPWGPCAAEACAETLVTMTMRKTDGRFSEHFFGREQPVSPKYSIPALVPASALYACGNTTILSVPVAFNTENGGSCDAGVDSVCSPEFLRSSTIAEASRTAASLFSTEGADVVVNPAGFRWHGYYVVSIEMHSTSTKISFSVMARALVSLTPQIAAHYPLVSPDLARDIVRACTNEGEAQEAIKCTISYLRDAGSGDFERAGMRLHSCAHATSLFSARVAKDLADWRDWETVLKQMHKFRDYADCWFVGLLGFARSATLFGAGRDTDMYYLCPGGWTDTPYEIPAAKNGSSDTCDHHPEEPKFLTWVVACAHYMQENHKPDLALSQLMTESAMSHQSTAFRLTQIMPPTARARCARNSETVDLYLYGESAAVVTQYQRSIRGHLEFFSGLKVRPIIHLCRAK